MVSDRPLNVPQARTFSPGLGGGSFTPRHDQTHQKPLLLACLSPFGLGRGSTGRTCTPLSRVSWARLHYYSRSTSATDDPTHVSKSTHSYLNAELAHFVRTSCSRSGLARTAAFLGYIVVDECLHLHQMQAGRCRCKQGQRAMIVHLLMEQTWLASRTHAR